VPRLFIAALLSVSFTALNGCTNTGTAQLKSANQDSIAISIKEHETTKDQVRSIFGEPARVSYTGENNEVWDYAFVHGTPTASTFIPIAHLFSHGSDFDTKLLVVEFDGKGIVDKYTFSERVVPSRKGIAE